VTLNTERKGDWGIAFVGNEN